MRTSIFQNSNENIVRLSALRVFIASLGLPVGFLVYDITYLAPRKPKKLPGSPQEATKKFRAEILEIILLVFRMKLSFHKDIIKLTDL